MSSNYVAGLDTMISFAKLQRMGSGAGIQVSYRCRGTSSVCRVQGGYGIGGIHEMCWIEKTCGIGKED